MTRHITKFYKLVGTLGRSTVLLMGLAGLTGCGPGLGGSSQKPDPVVEDLAVVYVKRPLILDDDGNPEPRDARDPAAFRPGAILYLKDRAAPSAEERDITSGAFAGAEFLNSEGQLLYDVKDLAVSPDGEQLAFAMRAPEIEGADEEDQPTWNIWLYNQETGVLRRVIASDTIAEAGQDIAPQFLVDGRIVFSSTRQRTARAILLDEGKGQFSGLEEDRRTEAFVLHVMETDGSGIEQLTFNQSHDLDPVVVSSGKVVFTRWDNAGSHDGMNLYQVNPDGTGLEILYGNHSHDTGSQGSTIQFLEPQPSESGALLVQVREYDTDQGAGIPTLINVDSFIDNEVTIDGSTGVAQTSLIADLRSDGQPTLAGQYGGVFPLYDGTGRYLISWSVCRLLLQSEVDAVGRAAATIQTCTQERIDSGNYIAANPIYGLWVYDPSGGSRLPLVVPAEGAEYTEAAVMISRRLPTFIAPATPEGELETLADEGFGVLEIRSVYDFDGVDTAPGGIEGVSNPVLTAVADRPARFLRIEKAVAIPDDTVRDISNTAFGRSTQQLMREILGYVPIEPDGSVRVAVPANVAFSLSVLDADGKRITARHQNWLQLMPGETRACNGCHTAQSTVPHGRRDAEPDSAYDGAATTGLAYPNSNPLLLAIMGETMAQTYARVNGTRRLVPDIVFEDEWTNTSVIPSADSFTYAYTDLQTEAPTTAACDSGSAFCRIVINYEDHIHPLWGVDRSLEDDEVTLRDPDQTCNTCHAPVDAMDAVQVPAAQLDLSDGASDQEPDHFKSYRELLFADNEQEVVGGVLVDRQVDGTDPLLDSNGDPVLDGMGNPVFVQVPVSVAPTMNVNGAVASAAFFARFETGGAHEGWLSAAELKLIAEWLDVGGQYYNNPFDAPEN